MPVDQSRLKESVLLVQIYVFCSSVELRSLRVDWTHLSLRCRMIPPRNTAPTAFIEDLITKGSPWKPRTNARGLGNGPDRPAFAITVVDCHHQIPIASLSRSKAALSCQSVKLNHAKTKFWFVFYIERILQVAFWPILSFPNFLLLQYNVNDNRFCRWSGTMWKGLKFSKLPSSECGLQKRLTDVFLLLILSW